MHSRDQSDLYVWYALNNAPVPDNKNGKVADILKNGMLPGALKPDHSFDRGKPYIPLTVFECKQQLTYSTLTGIHILPIQNDK